MTARLVRPPFALALTLVLAACAFVAPPINPTADILVVGDSIFAWHRGTGRSIPDVIESRSELTVSNIAVSGARFLGDDGIPAQYRAGAWQVVVFDGGGNDLSPVCGSGDELPVLDRLISADGLRGAIPDFARQITTDGAKAIVLGYFPISAEGGPFEPCEATLNTLRDRQMRMASALSNVTFVDSRRAVDPADLTAYAPDLIHPSPRGAELVGGLVAATLRN